MRACMNTLFAVVAAAALGSGAVTANAAIVNLSADMDSAQETAGVDPATPAEAMGSASMSFDTETSILTWNIVYSGLSEKSGEATGLHFHGPAAVGVDAGVVVNVGDTSGLPSPSIGSATLTAAQATELLDGLWYINAHTTLNGGGEIRGQVVVATAFIDLTSSLDTEQEIPAPSGAEGAMGSAVMTYAPDTNVLTWNIIFSGMSSAVQAMHFHGPAARGVATGVQLNIGEISGLASPVAGSAVITEVQEEELLAGDWYINIHTMNNGSGEIRGQVDPQPMFSDGFEGTTETAAR